MVQASRRTLSLPGTVASRGDRRVHSQLTSTCLVPAGAKSGPALTLGPCQSCGSHSPALASQGEGAGSRQERYSVQLATGVRSQKKSLGRICLFEKRVWDSEPANSQPIFPSHTQRANSMCLRHLICLEIPVAAGLSAIRNAQADGSYRTRHRCPLVRQPCFCGAEAKIHRGQ